MATIYRSTDTDAPTLPASGSYNSAGFLMDLLKACLVNGYGSKTAAGWSVDYEDTTADKRRIAFSNGNGVIELVTWGTNSVGMFIWDSITTPGVGRIYDDPWLDVVSDGVNGWKHEQLPAPGTNSEYCAGLYIYQLNQNNAADLDWTIHADDKSAWIHFHYPEGHANTEPGDAIATASATYYPQLFFGAVKSADLTRSSLGNFFIGYGGLGMPTSGSASSGSHSTIYYFWGLRTPSDTAPSPGNNPFFDPRGFEFDGYLRNPLSSARALLPVLVSYKGSDVPTTATLGNTTYSDYQFAALPGVAQIGKGDNSSTFWVEYNQENGASWNLQPHTIGGSSWTPRNLGLNFLRECGITDDAQWWT